MNEIKECTIDDLNNMDSYEKYEYLQLRKQWLEDKRKEDKKEICRYCKNHVKIGCKYCEKCLRDKSKAFKIYYKKNKEEILKRKRDKWEKKDV